MTGNELWNEAAPTKRVIYALLGLTVAMVVSMGVSFAVGRWDLIEVFSPYVGGNHTPFSLRQAPPGVERPRLQVDEFTDYRVYLASEKKILNSYGWVGEDKKVVRVPLERAIDMMLQKGYEVRGSR